MPSNKEILEAQRYNRRRLVTAFSSGTPGGRELESKSPFAPLLVGVVVVLIMLGVAAVMSRFAPQLPNNWDNSTLVVVKGTGARYYTINGVLRPVTNITSARLLADSGQYQTSELPASAIDGIARGSQIGLTGVPDDVPTADRLNSALWFSCGLPSSPHTWVAHLPQERTQRGAALVSSDGTTYLITNNHRYRILNQNKNAVILALGLDATSEAEVSNSWLSLFQRGSDLKPFKLATAGAPAGKMPGSLSKAVVGSLIEVEDSTEHKYLVVTGPGELTPLTEMAAKLYKSDSRLTTTLSTISGLEVKWDERVGPSDWPEQLADAMPEGSTPCAQLVQGEDGTSTSQLFSMEHNDMRRYVGARPLVPSDDENEEKKSLPPSTSVLGGSGALVRATSPDGSLGAVQLVSDLGKVHGLGASPADVLGRLGYTEENIHSVPAAWTSLIPAGPELNPQKAWETVGQQ